MARGASRILSMAQLLSKLQDHSRAPYYFLYSWWEGGLRLSILFCEGIKKWDESAKSRKANSNDFTTCINFFQEETNAIPRFRYFPFSLTYPVTSSDLSRLSVVETDINADLLTETETILDTLPTLSQTYSLSEKSLFFWNNSRSRMSQDRIVECKQCGR